MSISRTLNAPGDVSTPGGVAKLLIYIGLAALSIIYPALADDQISLVEGINATIAALGAAAVWYVTAEHWFKTIAAFVLAALQALVLVIADGSGLADVSAANWVAIVIAAFAAIGVAFVPNKPALDPDPLTGVYNTTNVAPPRVE